MPLNEFKKNLLQAIYCEWHNTKTSENLRDNVCWHSLKVRTDNCLFQTVDYVAVIFKTMYACFIPCYIATIYKTFHAANVITGRPYIVKPQKAVVCVLFH